VKRRRVIVIVGGCVVAGILGVALWPGEREPSYKGKTLYEWLGYHKLVLFDPKERAFAGQAVRAIGTNGVPWMLKWLKSFDKPDLGDKLLDVYGKVPGWLGSRKVERYLIQRSGRAHAEAAMNGFVILGPEARGALPELEGMAAASNSRAAKEARTLAMLIRGGQSSTNARPQLPSAVRDAISGTMESIRTNGSARTTRPEGTNTDVY